MSKIPNQPEARLKDISARPLITVTVEIATENNLSRIEGCVKAPARRVLAGQIFSLFLKSVNKV